MKPFDVPVLESLSEDAILHFVTRYELLKRVSADELPSLRTLIEGNLLSVIIAYHPDAEESDSELLNYLKLATQIESVREASSLFQNLRMNFEKKHANDRIAEYVSKFMTLKNRCDKLELNEDYFKQKFCYGMRPSWLRQMLAETVKAKTIELNELIRFATTEYLKSEQYRNDAFQRNTRVDRFPRKPFRDTDRPRRSGGPNSNEERKEQDRKKNACFYCHQPGHIAAKCPQKRQVKNEVNVVEEPEELLILNKYEDIYVVDEPQPEDLNVRIKCRIEGTTLDALLDTGAKVSCMSTEDVERCGLKKLDEVKKIRTADQFTYEAPTYEGNITLLLETPVSVSARFAVLPSFPFLLGRDVLTKLGITRNSILQLIKPSLTDDLLPTFPVEPPLNSKQTSDNISHILESNKIDLSTLNDSEKATIRDTLKDFDDVFSPISRKRELSANPFRSHLKTKQKFLTRSPGT
ncbi:hypothetical protein GEMRC1_012441 [Eukaryota sp. GEM-RC1]